MSDKNIDKDTKKFLDNMGNRLKLAKENGCKLLECKTIDNNIKLRLENIKLRKELETYKTEHKIMKRILVKNNLWETLLNDDEFIEHLKKED